MIPEVRGKTEIGRPDPSFTLPRPAVLLQKNGLCSEVSDFSRTSEIRDKNFVVLKRKRDKYPLENSLLNRENRLSAVSTDQAGRTVARPHHS